MVEIDVPGWGRLRCEHLVLDYNGTMAVDGRLLPGVSERLNALARHVTVHVLTADTFGRVTEETSGIRCRVTVLPPGEQDTAKMNYVVALGAPSVVGVGNGRNDRLMLKQSRIGIAVTMEEGTAVETLLAADIVVPHVNVALDLLANTRRLVATLRT